MGKGKGKPLVRRAGKEEVKRWCQRERALQLLPPEICVVLAAVERGPVANVREDEGTWLKWVESVSRHAAWSLLLFGCRCVCVCLHMIIYVCID